MKYFLDFEFHEYEKTPTYLFGLIKGKPVKTVELISVGIVSENGRTYYAESNEFDREAAEKHPFLAKSVLPNLKEDSHSQKSNAKIAQEILRFMTLNDKNPEIVLWWGAYDWYVLCRELFGTMTEFMDRSNIYFYTEYKTVLDDILGLSSSAVKFDMVLKNISTEESITHNALDDAKWLKQMWEHTIDMTNDLLDERFSRIAHDSLASLIRYTLGKGTTDKKGNIVIPKDKVDKWMDRAGKSFDELSDEQKITPVNEGKKYSNAVRSDFFKILDTSIKL